MEPTNATAVASTILTLVTASQKVTSKLDNVFSYDRDNWAKIRPHLTRFQAATAMLETISNRLPNNKIVPGVDISVKMCTESLNNIQHMTREVADEERKNKPSSSFRMDQFTKTLSGEVDAYADSVASLRAFSQEASTMYMIESMKRVEFRSRLGLQYHTELRKEVMETKDDLLSHMTTIMDMLDELTRSVQNTVPNDNRTLSGDDAQLAEYLLQLKAAMNTTRDNSGKRQEDLENMEIQLERTFTQQEMSMFNLKQSDEFVYDMSILSWKDSVEGAAWARTYCRATLDTACDDNWVSTSTIERANLRDSVEVITEPDAFGSFSGHVMVPQGQVELTFFLDMASGSSQQTRTEAFYVFDQLPVDLVLGKGFIAKQFTLVSKHALGLVKTSKLTKDEIRRMEASQKEKAEANAEISSQRKAASASAREARRAEKKSGSDTRANSGSTGQDETEAGPSGAS